MLSNYVTLIYISLLGHFSPIDPPSAAGFPSVAAGAGGLLWRKLERSKSLVLLQVGGWTCRWQQHSVKPSCWESSTTVEQAETHLRVVVPIKEEEEEFAFHTWGFEQQKKMHNNYALSPQSFRKWTYKETSWLQKYLQ
jgi:hypothetical protein